MKKLVLIMLAVAGSLAAADYSGIWNGKGGQEDVRYGTVPRVAQMTLIQAGGSLQGTVKIGSGAPLKISSGTVSGSQMTFAIVTGGGQITANLAQSGSQLAGKMTASDGKTFDFVFTKQ